MSKSSVSVKVTANTGDLDNKMAGAANSVSKFSQKAKAAEKNVKDFNSSAKSAASSISGIGSALSSGSFTGFIAGIGSAQSGITGLIGALKKGEIASLGFGNALKAALGPVGLITGAIAGIAGIAIKAGKDFMGFEQKVAELKSLTGLGDEVIGPLQDRIIDTAKEFSVDAGEITDSMKLIGSQKPDLLANADALLEVTKSANVLAKAGGMSVEAAAGSITAIMNSMDVASDKSDEIINVLAKAQQVGAVSVEKLSEMFVKTGAAASSAGVDYVQLAAMNEILGEKMTDTAKAGTQLKNVLNKMATADDVKINIKTQGVEKALENLSKMSDKELNEIFNDNAAAAKNLGKYRDRIKDLTSELQGTQSAYEQAAINTNTMEGAYKALTSAISNNFIATGKLMNSGDGLHNMWGGIIDVITEVTDTIFDTVNSVIKFVQQMSELDAVKAVIAGIKAQFEIIGTVLGAIIDIFKSLLNGIGNIIAAFTDFGNSNEDVWTTVMNGINLIKEGIQSLVSFISTVITTIVDIVVGCINVITAVFNKFVDWYKQYNEFMTGVVSSCCDAIVEFWNGVVQKIKGYWQTFVDFIVNNPITKFVVESFNKVKQLFKSVVDYILNLWAKFANFIKDTPIGKFIGNLCDSIKKMWKSVIDWLVKLWNKVCSVFGKKKIDITAEVHTKTDSDPNSSEETVNAPKTEDDNKSGSGGDTSKKKVKLVAEEGSIKKLEEQLQKLNDELNYTDVSGERVKEINAEKAQLEDEINKLKLRNGLIDSLPEKKQVKVSPVPGSIEDISKKISAIETQMKTGVYIDGNDEEKCKQELKRLKEELEKENIRLGFSVETDKAEKELKKKNDLISDITKTKTLFFEGIIDTEEAEKRIVDLNKKLQEMGQQPVKVNLEAENKLNQRSEAETNVNNIKEQVYRGVVDLEVGKQQIDKINEELQALGLQPIKVELETEEAVNKIEEAKKKIEDFSSVGDSMSSVLGSLGSAIGGTAGEFLNFAATAVQGITEIIAQIATMIVASQAESMAKGTSAAMDVGFPACIPALAAIIGAIAGIFASLPSFASGGMISGATTIGDYNLARVNGGEMILNQGQQGRLFSMLNSGSVGSGSSKSDVTFRISGSNLKGVQKNYDKKTSKLR